MATTTKSVSIVNNTSETAAPVTITASLTKIIVTVAVQQNEDFYQLAKNAGSWTGTIDLVDTNKLSLGSFTVTGGSITQNVVVSDHDYYQLVYSGTTLCIDVTLDPVRLGHGTTYSVKGVNLSFLTVSGDGDSRLTVDSHGKVDSSLVSSGGVARINGGTFSEGACRGGVMYAQENGTINGTLIADNGYLYVIDGGSACHIEITSGGQMIAEEGGRASAAVVSDGGYMQISGAAIAADTEIQQGGNLSVESGGTATSTTVKNGGLMTVSKGAAHGIEVVSGGCLAVSAGAVITGADITAGGQISIFIDSKTSVSGTSSGQAFVLNSQQMENFTVGSGWVLQVAAGTFQSGTVEDDGTLQITSKGSAADLVIRDGGTLYATGTLTGLEIRNGAVAELSGGSLNGTITVNGTLDCQGSVNGSGITQLTVDLEGTSPETSPAILGFGNLSNLNAVTIQLGDNQNTGYYTIADAAPAPTCGCTLLDGAKEYQLTIGGSAVKLDSGYTCRLKAQEDGLQLALLDDQEAPEITIIGDFETPASSITVYACCWNEEDAAITCKTSETGAWFPYDKENGLLITANGTYYFRAEDDAGNVSEKSITVTNIDNTPPVFTDEGENSVTVVRNTVYLTWKTAADESGISHYELLLNDEVYLTQDTELLTQLAQNGTYSPRVRAFDNAGNASLWMDLPEIVISVHDELDIQGTPVITVSQREVACSWQAVELGETAVYYELTLDDGTSVYSQTNSYTFTGVASGEHTISIRAFTEDACGAWIVTDPFNVEYTAIKLTAASASDIYTGTALTAPGYQLDGTLESGDTLYVTVEGSQTDTGSSFNTITSCQVKHGETDVTGNYNITTFSGVLSITQRSVTLTSGDASKIYDGTPLTNPTVSVSGDGFVSGEGVKYTVTGSQTQIGESNNTFSYDALPGTDLNNYVISQVEGILKVTPAAVSPAKSDVDGNGVSDVMFQYTGGDYQIGFWMNGTNSWQGQGIGQPSEWKLIGAYDMDQNGKADLVMRGDIQIGSDKGAYIGYYKDGDVTNWQNISFLNNSYDIDWRLAVGNITGNSGCNSLVWHAPELGALGVWTDGTSNWVSLGSAYNENWVMQGCGDFDGNGKDEVLFTYEGNLYSIDIDGNFAALGQGVNGWEVRAIGDFSGDGQDDIVLFREATGSVIKFENGTTYQNLGQLDAENWFIAGCGDYNGDQKDDLLVRQNSSGMLGYYESGDLSKWVELGRGVDSNWTVVA